MYIDFEKSKKWGALRPWRRHSLVLLVAGLVYIGIGASYLVAPISYLREEALYYALWWFSLDVWGCIWIFVGLMSIISSRWPPISETWGYTLLTGQSAAWCGFYLAGVALHGSAAINLASAATWALVAFLWWAISGLLNPDGKKAIIP